MYLSLQDHRARQNRLTLRNAADSQTAQIKAATLVVNGEVE
jgi:hypothetical protein